MGKTKGKSSSKKTSQVVQCPHLHFRTDIIDRNVLSKEQHLNLLSTPKGYRWDEYQKEGGDGETVEEPFPTRRIMCSGRRMKKAEKVYVHNFLAEVWNLLTPEMVDRLKGMLMNEFGMSPQQADDFICKQREENIKNSSTVSLYKKPRDIGDGKYVYDHVVKMRSPNQAQCDKVSHYNLGIRNAWIKDFSDYLSDMMSSYVLDTMCAGRNDRQKEIAQTLLNRFNNLLEQNATMSDPKTPTDKTLVLIADRLATWLDNNVGVSKEATEKIKTIGEAEQKRKMEENRKRRQEDMKKMRDREADEERQKLAEKLAQEEAGEFADEGKAHALDHEKEVTKEEGEERDKVPIRPGESAPVESQAVTEREQPGGQTAGEIKEGEAQGADQEPLKKETDREADVQQLEADEHKEPEEQKPAEGTATVEQQRAADELEQKEVDDAPTLEAAAAEAERQESMDEQKKAEQEAAEATKQKPEEQQKRVEQETAEAEQQIAAEQKKAEEEAERQMAVEEQRKADQEAERQIAADEQKKAEQEPERQIAKEEQKEAEQKEPEEEKQREDQDSKIKEQEEAREPEKQKSEDEQKQKPDEKLEEETAATEAPAAVEPSKEGSGKQIIGESRELSEEPLKPTDLPGEDLPPSETTESEPPLSEIEEEPVALLPKKRDEVKPPAKEEGTPVDEVTSTVAGPKEKELSPEEKEKRTNEVLKSVASIILETKADPSPRQEALKDIVEKHLEETLGDQDKEAIDKVSSKIGTWIDKIVDQASLEYGDRDSSRPPPGASEGIWAPASSRAQPPISGPGQTKIPSRDPDVTGTPAEPSRVPGATGAPAGQGLVPGAPGADGVPGDGAALRKPAAGPDAVGTGTAPAVSRAQEPGGPSIRAPVAQRPKGRIYNVGRTDSDGFDVELVSNTRALEKIRLARGKSPAFEDVPNPEEPMEPSDMKRWYKWTSALTEVAESWADWIKDTVKGTQQRGEDIARNNSPDRLNEWREFKDSQTNSARKWQQTKKEMERRAELWDKKRRRVQTQ